MQPVLDSTKFSQLTRQRTRRLMALVFVGLALMTSACMKSFSAKAVEAAPNQDNLTGGFKKDGTPYTSVGSPARLEHLKLAVPSTEANRRLSSKIGVPVIRLLDASGHPTESAPTHIDVRVPLLDGSSKSALQAILFHATLLSDSGVTKASHVKSVGLDQSWRLDITCEESDCRNTEMHLYNGQAEAGWITTERLVQIETLGPFTKSKSTVSNDFKNLTEEMKSETSAKLLSTEIAWGIARFELRLAHLCISGEATSTGDGDEPATVSCSGINGIHAALAGNSTKGDLLLRINSGTSWAFIRVRSKTVPAGPHHDETPAAPVPSEPQTGATNPSGTSPIPPAAQSQTHEPGQTLFPVDFSNPITAAIEVDRTNPEVVSAIQTWSTSSRMTAFLKRVRPNLPTMLEPLSKVGLPGELIFITFIESNFFVSDGYPVAVSAQMAVGPWQFLESTAKANGISARPVIEWTQSVNGKPVKHVKADACDPRGNLAQSSQAAAQFLKALFTAFPTDPKLAIMAYNWGPEQIQRLIRCRNNEECIKEKLRVRSMQNRMHEIQSAGFDYWAVREFHLAPKETLDYVVNFLAVQFVGRNPERYGLAMPTESYPEAPRTCKN